MKDGAAPVVRVVLGAILLVQGGCSEASSHFARYSLMVVVVSEPSQGLPQFIALAYMDDQLMGVYDSNRRRTVPYVPWVKKIEKEDPQLWAMHTQYVQNQKLYLGVDLDTVQKHYNQSRGFHTWQYMVGCELREDGRKGGFAKYSYDGRDYISFDKETLTWVATDVSAQITKRMWEADLPFCQNYKFFLEEECITWLQKYLDYGKEALQRKETPVVKVTHRVIHEGLETLLCQVHSFYPKDINATWRKKGKVRQGDTFRRVISPNVDGTYYTWLSIEINPKERSRYRCHVEHDGLQEPLDLPMEQSVSVWLIAVGVILVVLVVGVICCVRYINGFENEEEDVLVAQVPWLPTVTDLTM
ncbi:major histocompatibility complex class I-related gene protein-like [Tiliqua scincoides]|uniref:major histocompatibility complex class I-related gene protein-like n=1 Tax=Tiliqua scincoides TaxID=71010 RepID=UPI0034631EE8